VDGNIRANNNGVEIKNAKLCLIAASGNTITNGHQLYNMINCNSGPDNNTSFCFMPAFSSFNDLNFFGRI
jgi:hypothetical protein